MQSTMRFLSLLGAASMVAAHGIVQNITIAGDFYDLYDPYTTPYENPVPDVIGWTVQSNSPVTDVTSTDIVCNVDSTSGAISATAAAGSEVVLHWTLWPTSHKGPTMTYLALCDGECTDVSDPSTLDWFKIDEAGLYSDGTWASDKLIADGNTWTLSLPSSLKAGNYVMRHELLALHSAESVGGAQFYPVCMNLEITGDGTAFPTETVKFPGAYSATDPGIEINIYYPTPTSYDIPGPTVWSGASSGDSSSSTAAASATATASAASSATSSTEASSTDASSTEVAATATSPVSSVSVAEATVDPSTSLSPATTFLPATGVFTGTGTASTGFSAPTSAPAVQSADPATTGADGVVTSSITTISTSTFTSVQTIVMTKTLSETETLTVTATPSVSATGSAGLQDATSASSKSTVTMTATETITKAQTITETVTSTAQATACTPAGRFRRDLF